MTEKEAVALLAEANKKLPRGQKIQLSKTFSASSDKQVKDSFEVALIYTEVPDLVSKVRGVLHVFSARQNVSLDLFKGYLNEAVSFGKRMEGKIKLAIRSLKSCFVSVMGL